MKTTFNQIEIKDFLRSVGRVRSDSIEQLSEGHISQAFGFETNDGQKLVLRISTKDEDFVADKYVFEHFGGRLPVPKVVSIGKFGGEAYFCISQRVAGVGSNKLDDRSFARALPAVNDLFARVFQTDISGTSGYGHLDYSTGSGKYKSWKDAMAGRFNDRPANELKRHAVNIGLDPKLIDKFVDQYNTNLVFASEVRRLSHGDLGFDNLLIDNGKITAIIDWAGVGYAEWMYDYAKLDFWWPGRHSDAKAFGEEYGLEIDSIEQRRALYWARSALSTIEWADEYHNEHIAEWLRTYVEDRLIS